MVSQPELLYEPKFGLNAERTNRPVRLNSLNKNPNLINSFGQKPESVQPSRTERVRPTLSNPRVGRPSSGSTQLDDHFIQYRDVDDFMMSIRFNNSQNNEIKTKEQKNRLINRIDKFMQQLEKQKRKHKRQKKKNEKKINK